MSRLTDDEKEALRVAAAAAEPVLAKLKRLRDELDEKIAKFEVIVTSYTDVAGKRRKPSGEPVDGDEKQKRGMVTTHIDAVLSGGSDYREPEIRREIWQRFGVKYSRASVYTALRRGDGKKYEQKEKRWRLKASIE